MPDDPTVVALVTRARKGDQGAWNELVGRYMPLVWSICRRYQLSRADIDDVSQNVWLRTVEHLKALREPAALPGWLATTTSRECSRVWRARRRQQDAEHPLDSELTPDDQAKMVGHELEVAERNAILRSAFADLPPMCQRVLLLRMEGLSYDEISKRLSMSIGSIGPTRGRCLDKLRSYPPLLALMRGESPGGGIHG
jgi:RNA polymerase sigma factor (sigma-70 family)